MALVAGSATTRRSPTYSARSAAAQQWWANGRSFYGPEFAAFVYGLDLEATAPSVGEVALTLSSSRPEDRPAI